MASRQPTSLAAGSAERDAHVDRVTGRFADNVVHDLIAVANDLARHVTRAMRELGRGDLRPSFATLFTRIADEALPLGTLAEQLGISTQAASQTVGLAERAGYVAREPNPNDGRSKLVVLSDLGREVVTHGSRAIAARASSYADHIGPSRLSRFDAALERLRGELALPAIARAARPRSPVGSVGAVILIAERAKDELYAAMVAGGHGEMRATHYGALRHVGAHGARVAAIARAEGVSRQAVSATMQEIESLGYLRRERDEHDARAVVFTLSERGLQLVDDYVRTVDAIEQRYEDALGPSRFAQFAATARDLHHRLHIRTRTEPHARGASPGDAGRVAPMRPDREIHALAADLRHWLGSADATRLAAALQDQAEGARR